MILCLTYKTNGNFINGNNVVNITSRMRICNNLSDFEVERAKNALKTSLFTYLDGQSVNAIKMEYLL
jgi:hypothetical protein